jgi:hypothetical protein
MIDAYADADIFDIEHVPFPGRRVHFGFVHVKVYDPNEVPCVEDVDMLDVEALPFSPRRVHFGLVHVKVYDPNEAPHAEDAEIIDADSFGFEEPFSEPEEMVKEATALKMFNELDPVGVEVCNRQFVLPCVTNTACSTVFEEQEVPHDLVQEAFSNVRVKLSYLIGTLPCILFLTFLSLLILGPGRYHHLRA